MCITKPDVDFLLGGAGLGGRLPGCLPACLPCWVACMIACMRPLSIWVWRGMHTHLTRPACLPLFLRGAKVGVWTSTDGMAWPAVLLCHLLCLLR